MEDVNTTTNFENAGSESGTEETLKGQELKAPETPIVTAENIETWDKDKRYEPSWKKDPNNLYKSYREIEKVYGPLKKDHETLTGVFKKYDFDPTTLEDRIKEYQSLKDPKSDINQMIGYFKGWLSDPSYRQKVIEYFTTLEKEKQRSKYGENIPDEIIQEIENLKNWKTEKETKEKEEQYQKDYDSASKTIDSQVKKCEDFAKANGIDWAENDARELQAYCLKNGVEPRFIYSQFIEFVEQNKEYQKAREGKIREKVIAELAKQKKTGIISSKPAGGAAPAEANTFKSKIKADPAFKRIFGH
jgi:hypothetical protein